MNTVNRTVAVNIGAQLMTVSLILGVFFGTGALAAGPEVLRAKQAAEAQGYKFVMSHDEIVAHAKKEGSLRALVGPEPDSIKAMKEGFSRKYPFIKSHFEEITGAEAAQRFLLELKAGMTSNWDIVHLSQDFYGEYLPYLEKIDLLGMAEQGVLDVPPKMVDPKNRQALAVAASMVVVAYNKRLLPSNQVPKVWEDLLKPEFRGKKFFVDIRPYNIASLVPALGEKWVLEYARKLKEQQPLWVRGNTRALTALAAGEYALHAATNYQSVMRLKAKGAADLETALLEPIPIRLDQVHGIVKGAKHPYAALLFLEYLGGPEAQKILDDIEPLQASIYFSGSKLEQLIRGKKTSVLDWDHYQKMGSYMEEIFAAFGFPKTDVK